MKKLLLAVLSLFAVSYSYAQNTFPWPQNGNIGIGTTMPATALSVIGSGTFSNSITAGNTTLNSTGLQFSDVNNGYFNGTVNNGGLGYSLKAYHGLEMVNATGVIARFGSTYTSLNSYFNGKVGIGTPDPTTALCVIGTGQFSSTVIAGNATLSSSGLQFSDSYNGYFNGTLNNSNLGYSLKAYHGLEMVNAAGVVARLGTNYNSLNCYFNGNVGIGTTQTDKALTVNGTIHATEILVDQTVKTPDYVFDKDYDLASLEDVKTYIDQNHHLPEIPSAAQVAKDGINLGEMNTKLLKKIEELTLYLIQQNRELSIEKSKNLIQEMLIDKQQKQLNKISKKLHIN